MATQEKQPHGGSLTRPEKGEVLNPHGRPKKLITQLKEIGYHKSQVEMLLTRSQGKPKETIDQTIESKNFTITLNLDNDNLHR